MDVRIRNSEWESDEELQGKMSKYVTKGLQRNDRKLYASRFSTIQVEHKNFG